MNGNANGRMRAVTDLQVTPSRKVLSPEGYNQNTVLYNPVVPRTPISTEALRHSNSQGKPAPPLIPASSTPTYLNSSAPINRSTNAPPPVLAKKPVYINGGVSNSIANRQSQLLGQLEQKIAQPGNAGTPSNNRTSLYTKPRTKCVALYNFERVQENDMSLNVGDLIEITKEGDGWWTGNNLNTGASGTFPSNYVQKQ